MTRRPSSGTSTTGVSSATSRGTPTVALSVDGRRALTGSYDKTAILWALHDGLPIRATHGSPAWVASVALSVDGRRALTGSYDKTAILWDLDDGRQLRALKGHTVGVTSV